MALTDHTIKGNNGGRITIAVGNGWTGAELTVESADGSKPVTVIVGGPGLLKLAGHCAAMARGVRQLMTIDERVPLFAGYVDYGSTPEGFITLTDNNGEVVVTLESYKGGEARCELDTTDLAELAQVAAAAGHDL